MDCYDIFSPYVCHRKDLIILLSPSRSKMRALRSTWGARVLAALLATSLLSLVLLPVGQKTSIEGTASYATWLRAQATGDTDATFDEALTTARASDAHSLHEFLTAFVEAYEGSSEQLAKVFAAGDRSGAALIRYLERHYLRLAGGEVYASLTAAAASLLKLDRLVSALPSIRLLQDLDTSGGTQLKQWLHTPLFVLSLRTLFSAQPLGP